MKSRTRLLTLATGRFIGLVADDVDGLRLVAVATGAPVGASLLARGLVLGHDDNTTYWVRAALLAHVRDVTGLSLPTTAVDAIGAELVDAIGAELVRSSRRR